ncbi:MAG: hypothetical protein HUJ22_11005 [Gracilimonas sp.]|jgi:hypothetical protein|uniref:hypothetical protein n=1 Tax=Gracilimonas sp. TaxID=1974203 RepID=UPI00198434F8|nr:hypothetical protein [Gracilimonas sp.]MBD3617087.1 hypothetical protein [Gracilimonas sp.]
MVFEEFVIAIVAIIGGLGFAGFLFWNVFSLIRQWINRKSGSSDINPQFFKALGEFKKNTERRITNLEAIVSDLEEERYRLDENQETMGDIEIEEEEVRSSSKKGKDNDGNLRNMLNE